MVSTARKGLHDVNDADKTKGGLLAWIDAADRKVEHWLTFLFYGYLFAILTVEVIGRAVGHSIVWAVETSLYAFIWLTYLSAAQLTRNREHLAFTLFRDRMNRAGQFVCLAISDACLAVVSLVIVYYMWNPLADAIRFNQQMTGADAPIWLAMIAVPVGWIVVFIRVVQRFVRLVRDLRAGRPLAATAEGETLLSVAGEKPVDEKSAGKKSTPTAPRAVPKATAP